MDRISSLPDEVICQDVSFLEFDNTVENQGSLNDYLYGLLALPASSQIRNVSIKLRGRDDQNLYDDLNKFLCNVLKRGVLKLKLDVWVSEDEGYSLPFEVFTCKTLVELELGSILKIDLLPENALLPALKTLTINSVRFSNHSGCAFQKLLSACPVLVELRMLNVEWEHWEWSRTVSSPTLERLIMTHKYYFAFIGNIDYDLKGITFDTPSLTNLKYYDFPPQSYPMVKLDSLVEATVGLKLPLEQAWIGQYARHDDITKDVTNLIKGLRNVEILNLSSTDTLEVNVLYYIVFFVVIDMELFLEVLNLKYLFQAFYFSREAIPVFENLHHLSIVTECNFCWRALPYLLKKSPNLKTLVIKV